MSLAMKAMTVLCVPSSATLAERPAWSIQIPDLISVVLLSVAPAMATVAVLRTQIALIAKTASRARTEKSV